MVLVLKNNKYIFALQKYHKPNQNYRLGKLNFCKCWAFQRFSLMFHKLVNSFHKTQMATVFDYVLLKHRSGWPMTSTDALQRELCTM